MAQTTTVAMLITEVLMKKDSARESSCTPSRYDLADADGGGGPDDVSGDSGADVMQASEAVSMCFFVLESLGRAPLTVANLRMRQKR